MAGSDGNRITPRRDARFETDSLRCELGPIVDLSLSGMCVLLRHSKGAKSGEVRTFTLKIQDRLLPIEGRVAWVARMSGHGGLRVRAGIEFIGIDEELRGQLLRLAIQGTVPARARRKDDPEDGSDVPDLYKVLGIPAASTQDDIDSAFALLAGEVEPRVETDERASQRLDELWKVYRVLGDADTRARYDVMRKIAA